MLDRRGNKQSMRRSRDSRSLTPEKLPRPAKRHRGISIIGLAGPNGAGKGCCAEYLQRYGFQHEQIRAYLSELVREKGMEPTRPNMLEVANQLRDRHGPAVLVQDMCERAKKLGHKYVIDSVRTVAEAKAVKHAGGLLLAVNASEQVRYERINVRQSTTDGVSREQFREQDDTEWSSDDPGKPNLKTVLEMSDTIIQNGGSREDLQLQLHQIFGQPQRISHSAQVCLVGPHGTGKTTLLRKVQGKLSSAGVKFETCEELARPLIQEMGLKQDDFIMFTDAVIDFQYRLLERYKEKHSAALHAGSALLSDRSVLDQIAYLDWQVQKGRVGKTVLDEAWRRADMAQVRVIYKDASFFLLRPEAGLCRDDGTRMLSAMDDLQKLYQAFERVLKKAGVNYTEFSVLQDDPDIVVRCFTTA